MLPIPDDLLKPFNSIMDDKVISKALRDNYRTCLICCLYFRNFSFYIYSVWLKQKS